MDWTCWLAHFDHNRTRPLPDPTADLDALPAPLRLVLADALAKFQRGETGEGRIANEVRRIGWDTIDDTYVAALKAFVAEEGRHARILGLAVKALGGRAAPEAWSGRLFEAGRRALDPRFELVALLGAEVAAIAAYQVMVDALPACGLRDALTEMVGDEHVHLDFHATLFAEVAGRGARRVALVGALSSVVAAAGAVLLADHAALWRALGVSPATLAAALRQAGALAIAQTAARQEPPLRGEMAA